MVQQRLHNHPPRLTRGRAFQGFTSLIVVVLSCWVSPLAFAAECSSDGECNDNNPCTDDQCSTESLCVHTNNTLGCDDSDACTAGETCTAGVCGGGESGAGMKNTFYNQTTQGWVAASPPAGTTVKVGAGFSDTHALQVDGPLHALIRKDKVLIDPINLTGKTGSFVEMQEGASISVVTNQEIPNTPGVILDMYVFGKTHKGRFLHSPFDGNGSTEALGNGWFRLWFDNHNVKTYVGLFGGQPPADPYVTIQFIGFAPSDFRFDEIVFQGPGSCDDENPCTIDICAPSVGCHSSTAPVGTLCDDSQLTTWGDMCNASGTCLGMAVDCNKGPCDLSATPNGTANCEYVEKKKGDPCNDEDETTANDECSPKGQCKGTKIVCEENLCTSDTIYNGTTECEYLYFPEGTECDDDDPTTDSDQCQGGAKIGVCEGTAIDCFAELGNMNENCIDKENTQIEGGQCTYVFLVGVACDDNNPTTENDQCSDQGNCGGEPVECESEPPEDSCFLKPVPSSGGCIPQFKMKDAPCDDGDPITKEGTCDGAGSCLPGDPIVCAMLGPCVSASTPNGVDCTDSPAVAGTPCFDDDPNTSNDVCDGTVGGCSGEAYVCELKTCELSTTPDGTACLIVHSSPNTACDDGDNYTKDDQCDGQGSCLGTPFECPIPQGCIATSKPNGVDCEITTMEAMTSCDDGDDTTHTDTCDANGLCEGIPIDCFADNGGKSEECIATATPNGSECDYTYNEDPCDDGDLSTADDECDDEGYCIGPNTIVCVPTDCEVSATANGADCTVVAEEDDTACDDGDDTTNALCQSGLCVGTPKCEGVVCEASDQCHVAGACAPTTGICSNPTTADETPCNDENACTTTDACKSGECIGGEPPDCNDDNSCTTDSCEPVSGCQHANNTDACDDSVSCTTGDLCTGGACAGTPYTCSECETCDGAGACTINDGHCRIDDQCYAYEDANTDTQCMICDPLKSTTEWTPTHNNLCDDGDPCTTYDVCSEGLCGGEDVEAGCTMDDECEQRNIHSCVVATCNVSACACVTDPIPLIGSACDDGDVCTEAGVCSDGECASTPVNCNDDNPCTTDTCNDTGCINTPNTELCDDANSCTIEDSCGNGACAGAPIVCANGERCTDGACESLQCEPCEVNSDCGGDAVCLESTAGTSCMVLCDSLDDCAEGSACEEGPAGLSRCISEACAPSTEVGTGDTIPPTYSGSSTGCALRTTPTSRATTTFWFLLGLGVLCMWGRHRWHLR